jgi:hypothetical protein
MVDRRFRFERSAAFARRFPSWDVVGSSPIARPLEIGSLQRRPARQVGSRRRWLPNCIRTALWPGSQLSILSSPGDVPRRSARRDNSAQAMLPERKLHHDCREPCPADDSIVQTPRISRARTRLWL